MARHSIRKEDVKFIVNKEKRTVICLIEDTENVFVNFAQDNFKIDWTYRMDYNKLRMPNRFVGKAVCAESDEWDEEKGKLLAYDRMKNELTASFQRSAQYFVNWYDKELSNAVKILNDYGEKLHHNKERRQSVICNMFEE